MALTNPMYSPMEYYNTIMGYGPQSTAPGSAYVAPAPGPTVASAAALPTTVSSSSPAVTAPIISAAPITGAPTPVTADAAAGNGNVDPASAATAPLDWNLGTLDLGIKGIQSLGGLWAAWQQNKIAKDQIKLSRDTTNVNLANQISAYNTALEDKTRHRASFNELSSKESDDYLASHKMANRQI